MTFMHEIHESQKVGINAKESYIVTRGRTSFLRILGKHPCYQLVTATASEDRRHFLVCQDKSRLISAAWKFGLELKTQPTRKQDMLGREYVYICDINIKPGGDSKEDSEILHGTLDRFFQIYDSREVDSPVHLNEMKEIYQAISSDDSGNDIYLSDGVWLGSDGSLYDRGR